MFTFLLCFLGAVSMAANSKGCNEAHPNLEMKCEVANPIKNEPTLDIPEKIETKKSSQEAVSSAAAAIPEKNPLREKRDRWKNLKVKPHEPMLKNSVKP